ncbi:hypothetical protein [Staphylococcus xylosus]|uniref:hypothetical protein n=1 Tax=Staphylococcus xylosus TaxID=1288 RepID=UPI000D1D3161|nr:hypothetical protein [Staphylococcus xylosus]PTH99286.1 hypothetical protein BU099_05040 [Staphylococcus xylosus]
MIFIMGLFFFAGWAFYAFNAYGHFINAVEEGDKSLLFGHTVYFTLCTCGFYFLFNLFKSFLIPVTYYY